MDVFSVILPAAGSGLRFGANKLIADLAGQPVIVWSINAFLQRADVSQIIIATSARSEIEKAIEDLNHSEVILNNHKLVWSSGGQTRAHTVRNALQACTSDYVAIHDAARPLISQELISQTFDFALKNGAAAPALPVTLTIKEVDSVLPGRIIRTIPRQKLYALQTPQCMMKTDMENGFKQCPVPLDQITDDLQILELAGKTAYLVPGEDRNIKITTPMDLRIAHQWLQS